jgi:hypothetical protein
MIATVHQGKILTLHTNASDLYLAVASKGGIGVSVLATLHSVASDASTKCTASLNRRIRQPFDRQSTIK